MNAADSDNTKKTAAKTSKAASTASSTASKKPAEKSTEKKATTATAAPKKAAAKATETVKAPAKATPAKAAAPKKAAAPAKSTASKTPVRNAPKRPAVARPKQASMSTAGSLQYATGKRKNAVARVWLIPGSGKITVAGKDYTEYFARPVLQMVINQPFSVTNTLGQFDIVCTCHGGGLSGQASALRHGISKALVQADEGLRILLRQADLLTRDSRVVERKKYGHKKARRSFQFSKR